MRTVSWVDETTEVEMIDQRQLPARFVLVRFNQAVDVAQAIKTMVVRGAPAIGAAAAFGMAMAAARTTTTLKDEFISQLEQAGTILKEARPTAVNLKWAVDRMLNVIHRARAAGESVSDMQSALLKEAQTLADEDVATNRRMAAYAADLINEGDTIIHHCNTGALATVDYGTALGVIRKAHEDGKRIHVLVDETRPRLQGARLTAWELSQLGISYEIITDNMAGHFLRRGEVQLVLFGADRVAANGDVANKIGSYMLALAAHANAVPVYTVFPFSTLDRSLASGDLIPIEEREASEVLDIRIGSEVVVPAGAKARNPAFDVTPHHLFTGWITDHGIIYPPFSINIGKLN